MTWRVLYYSAHTQVLNPDQTPWQGCHVYKVLKQKRNGRRYALISGWPTPVSEVVRTQFPPLPGRPSYCREARQWAKSVLQQNQRKQPGRGWIGPYSLRWLRAVRAGLRPLNFADYHSLRTYWAPKPEPVVRVPVRLGIAGFGVPQGQPSTAQFRVLTPGTNGYGRGGRVMPDWEDEPEDDD